MNFIPNLPNYQIIEEIYSGTRTVVYRGIRTKDQLAVVIKLLRNEYPNFNELLQFRNQYTIAKNLNIPSIIQCLVLEVYRNSYALIMEDFGGVSLSASSNLDININQINKYLPLGEFLNIAIQLADILHYLYQNQVIHKDIKPANILINPDTKQVKLIDFSISSLLPRETQEIQNPNVLEGTLAYISPEQTGRMNRGIDYRSDFYSLGVTFYQLLIGKLPFEAADAMELVHCHLAKHPILIHQINSEIPLVLSEIVSKLMAKNAENRYQTALGLKHDLEICLTQLQTTGKLESFKLGERDISDRFIIPEKLYGRETEINQLLTAFERVSTGKTEIMLVAGFSGIGKTAVVNEVHKPIVRQRGYFIKGKYDQFQRNIPFSAFVQAFRDLMAQLLSESDDQLQTWKTQIIEAVGDSGQVLIDVIPELEHIIGKQSPATELSGNAVQNRFNLLFQKFLQVFTSQEHPLVIFLDDLQWADSASLNLLKLLLQDTGYLLVLGAYRDHEVSPVHPFILTVDELVKTGATVNTITLPPLRELDLNSLVADTLNCELSLAKPLTQLVYQKTQGNPFFATQFLKSLHDDKLISFDWDMQHWQCDIAKVKALVLTDDVVEFMALQLQKLPTQTQDMLKLAACIGAEFDFNTLVIVSEQSVSITATTLWKALQEGLVIPITRIYKFFTQSDSKEVWQTSANPTYRFLHDRVQQAAYSLIPDDQKQATHLKIGQLLLHSSSLVEQEEKLFDIVRHFNQGQELITAPQEREALAKLNLKAGQKARNSTAYTAARIYLQIGIDLLTADCWQNQYELTLNLYVAATETAYLNADLDQMEEMATLVLERAKTILDKIKIYETLIASLTAKSQMLEAIAVGRDALALLGIELPAVPDEGKISKAFQTLAKLQNDRGIEELIDLPVMSDRQTQATMQLLGMLFTPIMQGMPGLTPILSATMVSLSLQFGNAPASTVGYAIHSIVLCAFLGDVKTGYNFGRLALNLLDRFNHVREYKSTVIFLFGCFIQHHQESLRAMMLTLKDGYTTGMETGDFLNSSYSICTYFNANLLGGVELDTWEPEIIGYRAVLVQTKQYSSQAYLNLTQQVVQNLRETRILPDSLIGDTYDETVIIPQQLQNNDFTLIAFAYIYKLILAYIFGNYKAALDYSTQAKQYLMSVSAMIFIPIFYFYTALTHLALLSTEQEQADLGETDQTTLKQWAQNAPMNHLHKWHLVEAERQRVLGHKIEALEHYDHAIFLAKENKFFNEEALANELAMKFYLEWGKEKFAQIHALDAYYAYSRWGAKAKVIDLEKRYPQLLAPILQPPRLTNFCKETLGQGTISGTHISSSVSEAIDLATLLKASQTISGRIELNKLLTTLIEIVIANAGASKCVLLMKQDLDLKIVALGSAGESPQILPSISLELSQDVAISLVNTVKRTLEPLVLADVGINSQFAGDRYIQKYQPKSILCSPILNQGQLLGVLYLENNVTMGAFTSDRIEVLNLICAQAAISLENARLYQKAQQALTDLQQAQLTIIQSEKMSTLGNLVAGVAHEINNPIGFLGGNIQPALDYINDLLGLLDLVQEKYPQLHPEVEAEIATIDLEYIREDLPKLVSSMREGVNRIKDISTSLRTFSRADVNHPVACNIHDGIDSTIMILKHRLKATENRPEIQVIKHYGDLPQVNCYAGQLNQVFMNIMANAIDMFDEVAQLSSWADLQTTRQKITIQTSVITAKKAVEIRISDNGKGMTEEVKSQIFNHLFTTKSVGKGTGLGLAIAHEIIEKKHQGTIKVNSELGVGTEFILSLPISYSNCPSSQDKRYKHLFSEP